MNALRRLRLGLLQGWSQDQPTRYQGRQLWRRSRPALPLESRGAAKTESETAVLEQVRSLSIHGKHVGRTRGMQGPIADFATLAELPFRELRELRLTRLRCEQLAALLRSPALAGLEVLALRLRFTLDELNEIAQALALPALRELQFGDIYGGSALAALADVPLPALEVLAVGGVPHGNVLDHVHVPALGRIAFAGGVLEHQSARASRLDPRTAAPDDRAASHADPRRCALDPARAVQRQDDRLIDRAVVKPAVASPSRGST